MITQIIGIQKIDFTNSDGQQIVGINIFAGYDDENVVGKKVEKFFVKESVDIPKDLKPNDRVNILFNSKGKVEGIVKHNA